MVDMGIIISLEDAVELPTKPRLSGIPPKSDVRIATGELPPFYGPVLMPVEDDTKVILFYGLRHYFLQGGELIENVMSVKAAKGNDGTLDSFTRNDYDRIARIRVATPDKEQNGEKYIIKADGIRIASSFAEANSAIKPFPLFPIKDERDVLLMLYFKMNPFTDKYANGLIENTHRFLEKDFGYMRPR